MPIYFGNSEDGSDAKEFKGFYVSPCGNFWGTEPFINKHKKGYTPPSKRRYNKKK
jgi:hypothetical protein